MSDRYISLLVRARNAFSAFRMVIQQAVTTSPVAQGIATKTKRDPTSLLICLSLILASALLMNPAGSAPYLANILAFLPALATLRHIDRAHTAAQVEQGKFLLDYWLCVGTSVMLERLFSANVVDAIIPVWWLVKGMAGIAVWASANKGSISGMGNGRQRALTLDSARSARRVDDQLPEAEPSPSPVADVMSALLQGFPGSASSHLGTGTDASSVDTASFLRDNAAPFTVLDSKAPSSNKPYFEPGALGPTHEFTPAGQPQTPTAQLDAFLDTTAGTYGRSAYDDAAPTTPAVSTSRGAPAISPAQYEDQLSPAFVLDFPSREVHETAPTRLPKVEVVQKKEGKNKGSGQKSSGRGMTLDELLASESE